MKFKDREKIVRSILKSRGIALSGSKDQTVREQWLPIIRRIVYLLDCKGFLNVKARTETSDPSS